MSEAGHGRGHGPGHGHGPGAGAAAPQRLHDEPENPPILETETVFKGHVWNVVSEKFAYGSGEITRDYVEHPGAVGVLALDDEDRMLLIRQYRHPVRYRDWEIPAGLLDEDGEPPLEAAQRELAEEADLTAEDWSVLTEFYTSPGGSSEAIRVYLARGLAASDAVFERTDEEADIEVLWVPIDEVVDAVLRRRVDNPALIISALAAHASRERGWDTLGDARSPWPRHPKWAPRS